MTSRTGCLALLATNTKTGMFGLAGYEHKDWYLLLATNTKTGMFGLAGYEHKDWYLSRYVRFRPCNRVEVAGGCCDLDAASYTLYCIFENKMCHS